MLMPLAPFSWESSEAGKKFVEMLYEKPNSCYIFSHSRSLTSAFFATPRSDRKTTEKIEFKSFAYNLKRELRRERKIFI